MAHKGDMWNDLHVDRLQRRPAHPAAGLHAHESALRPQSGGGHWLAELYVTNLTDKNAIVYSNTDNFDICGRRPTSRAPSGCALNYRFGKETNFE